MLVSLYPYPFWYKHLQHATPLSTHPPSTNNRRLFAVPRQPKEGWCGSLLTASRGPAAQLTGHGVDRPRQPGHEVLHHMLHILLLCTCCGPAALLTGRGVDRPWQPDHRTIQHHSCFDFSACTRQRTYCQLQSHQHLLSIAVTYCVLGSFPAHMPCRCCPNFIVQVSFPTRWQFHDSISFCCSDCSWHSNLLV